MGTFPGSSPKWPQTSEDSQLQFLHQNFPGFESSLRLSLQPSPPSPPRQWRVTVSVLLAGSEGGPKPSRNLCPLSRRTHWDNGVLQWSRVWLGPNTGAATRHEGSEMGVDRPEAEGDMMRGCSYTKLLPCQGPDTLPRTPLVERVWSLPFAPQTTGVVCVVSLSPYAQMARGPSSTVLGETPIQHKPMPLQ